MSRCSFTIMSEAKKEDPTLGQHEQMVLEMKQSLEEARAQSREATIQFAVQKTLAEKAANSVTAHKIALEHLNHALTHAAEVVGEHEDKAAAERITQLERDKVVLTCMVNWAKKDRDAAEAKLVTMQREYKRLYSFLNEQEKQKYERKKAEQQVAQLQAEGEGSSKKQKVAPVQPPPSPPLLPEFSASPSQRMS